MYRSFSWQNKRQKKTSRAKVKSERKKNSFSSIHSTKERLNNQDVKIVLANVLDFS